MRAIVDAMGGDNAPEEIVKGALLAAREINDEIVLVGDKKKIKKILKGLLTEEDVKKNNLTIFPASQVIETDESPVKSIIKKKDSSIVVGLNILKDGLGDVFISAGNTGALLAGGEMILKNIDKIERSAIASLYPVFGKRPSILIDCGANSECKARNLVDFARMGSIYAEKLLGLSNPSVGLVNIGAESKKGNRLTQKAFELLSESKLNFKGNLEARDLPVNPTDVIVTDGFTGNVILKLTEGMASLLSNISEETKASSYKDIGGAPILGLTKPVFKMHGSSDAESVKNGIINGIRFAGSGVISDIKRRVAK